LNSSPALRPQVLAWVNFRWCGPEVFFAASDLGQAIGDAHPAAMLSQDDRTKPPSRRNLAWVPLEHLPVGPEDWKMRSLGISAIVLAACLATLSRIFIGLAYSD